MVLKINLFNYSCLLLYCVLLRCSIGYITLFLGLLKKKKNLNHIAPSIPYVHCLTYLSLFPVILLSNRLRKNSPLSGMRLLLSKKTQFWWICFHALENIMHFMQNFANSSLVTKQLNTYFLIKVLPFTLTPHFFTAYAVNFSNKYL